MAADQPQIGFYHLEASTLDQVLPPLLLKAYSQGLRAVVRAAEPERVAQLDALLWTFDAGSFLPHGSARDGAGANQPIWLTVGLDVPNAATLLVLVDGAEAPDIDQFARVCDVFDGHDADALASARARWRSHSQAGYPLTYWQQGDQGGWQKRG